MPLAKSIALLALLAACPPLLRAQSARFDFYEHGPYRAEVPRPSAILGYEPGQFHTDYGNMERVVRAIAQAAPDRVRVFETGRSEEHRTLYLIAVSSPENIRRLDDIRMQTARLADPRATPPADAQRIIEGLPVTVWLNYANDGNETSAFETGIQALYQFAASNEPATLQALHDAVVLIRPAHNPESHERFVAWYNAFATGAADHAGLEHDAPWGMSTNNNHYQIDLNRDALVTSQRETQNEAKTFLEWHPQVFVDHHGELSQFYFPPWASPVNRNVPPQTARWTDTIGIANAAAFDRYGWPYYVRDVFDLFYAGYWDSWPALNGATGLTYETDGGGDMGLSWRRDDGTIATLAGAIAKHFTASLATVQAAALHRAGRLRDYYDFRRTAIDEARQQVMKSVVIVPGSDPRRAAELVEVLLRGGIEVTRADGPVSATLAHDYLAGAAGGRGTRRSFPVGAYVVDLAQPQGRLARAILEPTAGLDSDFVREQLARRGRNARRGENGDHEDFQFYDVTAWALPYTFGVEAYWTEDAAALTGSAVTLPEGDDPAGAMAGAGGVSGGRARSAYLFPNDRNGAGALAIALLEAGYRVAVSPRPLRADGRSWPRGTFVVRIERNPESVHDSIGPWARRFNVDVTAVQSAWPDSGAAGIGSADVVSLKVPRILVAAGEGVWDTEYGALWYFLERVVRVPFTPVRTGAIGGMDNLGDYNVLMFPAGSPSRYERELGEEGIKRVADWIAHGGVFIGWQGGARFAMRKNVDWTSSRIIGADDSTRGDSTAARDTTLAADQRPGPPLVSATAPNGSAPLEVPGSIFRATLDQSHWLTFGYERDRLPVMVSGDQFFRPSRAGANPVAFTGDSLTLSGFAWPGNTERLLRNSAWAVVENKGSGHVVLFADSPVFRLFWRSTYRLLQNAILMGTGR
jgi:hypothetical protein